MKEITAKRLNRRGAALMALVSGAVVLMVAALLVPWDWVPGGVLTPVPASDLFTSGEIARAEEFSSRRRVLSWSSYGISLATGLLLGFTPLGARLLGRLGARLQWWACVNVAVLALLVLGRLITLPLALLIRRQDLAYDLTRQGLAEWFADIGKDLLVTWAVTTLVLLLAMGIARRFERHWHVAVGGAAAALTVAGSFFYPVVVEPLFNDFERMPLGPFRASVLELAEQESVQVEDVLVADASQRTTTLNAYVSGLWGTRRIVVYDTLLAEMSPEQARVVIAHELAHAKNRDVLLGTSLGALGCLVAVPLLALVLDSRRFRRMTGISGPADPKSVATVLALVAVGSVLVSPVTNTISRAIEARADRGALLTTHDDQDFVRIQRQLSLAALHDPTPPAWSQFWFGSHPTVLERAGLPSSLDAPR